MFSKFGFKLLVGAAAIAIAGTAAANTTLDATTTGDLFLNIVDPTTNTSYLFDTGVSQSAFNNNTSSVCDSNGSCSFSLSGDTNLTGFLNSKDGDYFSVVSSTKNPTTNIDITGNTTPGTTISTFNDNQAQGAIGQFLIAANAVTSSSTSSVVLPTGSYWGAGLSEGSVSNRLFANSQVPYSDQAAVNSSLAFYDISGNSYSTFAGTWSFSSATDTLTYSSVSAVPLPTPVLLLLSGLGLMGAVSRRAKAVA
jgi:hypothetical protein